VHVPHTDVDDTEHGEQKKLVVHADSVHCQPQTRKIQLWAKRTIIHDTKSVYEQQETSVSSDGSQRCERKNESVGNLITENSHLFQLLVS
jgi:hypothetical protein